MQRKIDERNKNLLKVAEWGKSVFEQFDTDKNGQLDKAELNDALRSLPRTKPKYAPPGTKFMSIGDMVSSMDTDGDGQVSLEEWLENISACAGLCAALFEHQVDGKLSAFKSLEQRKAALEGKLGTLDAASDEASKLQGQIDDLSRRIEAAGTSAS